MTIEAPAGINADYAFIVQDDGMHAFGIHENDTVFIRAQDFAGNGDFVIIMENGKAILRKYNQCGELNVFTAGDLRVPSIIADEDAEIPIVGKVVGIFRALEEDCSREN